MNLDVRAHLSEWMDEPCSYEDFRACLDDLAQVNRLTFAYRPTIAWLNSVVVRPAQPIHIVDVGAGGGDMLRQIERWAQNNGVPTKLTGIDLNPYAARAARERTSSASNIEWITGDAFSYEPPLPIDLVVSSLFTHHLPDDQIVSFLQWMESVSAQGWFINDLHRQPVPYHGFQLLSTVLRWHRFVRHDGPVSFRRAFRPSDWLRYLAEAQLDQTPIQISEAFPARLCVSRVKQRTSP